jgi:hypothetical protein
MLSFIRQADLIYESLIDKDEYQLTFPEQLFKALYKEMKEPEKITELEYISANKRTDDALFDTYFNDDMDKNEYEKIAKETEEVDYAYKYYFFLLENISRLLISYLMFFCIMLDYDYKFLFITTQENFQKYNLTIEELKDLLIYLDENFYEKWNNLIQHLKALIYLILYLFYISNLSFKNKGIILNKLKGNNKLAVDYRILEQLTHTTKDDLLEKLKTGNIINQPFIIKREKEEIKGENLKEINELIKSIQDKSSLSIKDEFITYLLLNNGLLKNYDTDELDELDELARFVLYIYYELNNESFLLQQMPEINPAFSDNNRILNLFYLLAYILYLKMKGKLTDDLLNELKDIPLKITFLENKTKIRKSNILQKLQKLQKYKIGGDKKRKKKILKRYKNKK